MEITELPNDAWYSLLTGLPTEIRLEGEEFERVWNLHPVDYGQVRIMGRVIDTPRYQQAYGKDYRFTGMNHPALPLEDPYLLRVLEWVKSSSGLPYNSMLLN